MSRWTLVTGAARVLDPGAGLDGAYDVWIRDDVVQAALPAGGKAPAAVGPADRIDVVDAAGTVVTPMFVDLHVHLREPGGEEAETIATGCRAALAGGYAVLYAMANTSPTCDTPERIGRVRETARAAGPVEVVPISALSRGLRGRELVDLEANAAAGAGGFSDDGAWLGDERLARQALRWSARNGVPVMQHCEDFDITGPGILHDCTCVRRAGLPGISREAEDRAVQRDVRLAEEEQAALHVCHVSTAGAVDAIRRARSRGLPVTGEATPHHLVLTCRDAVHGGADYKMKPPLREASDVDAVVEALGDGTLAAVATDHAPHSDLRKAAGMQQAPFGAIGVETAFPVLYTHLVARGRLGLERLLEVLTGGPCEVVGRRPPRIETGAPAQLNFLDLETVRTVDRGALHGRSHNCPFHGMALRGWPLASLLGGRLWRHGVSDAVRIRTRVARTDVPGGFPEGSEQA